MSRIHPFVASSLSLVVVACLHGTEVSVTFEGQVIRSALPGIARGQAVSGRLVYDNTAQGIAVPEAGVVTYDAVRLFEVTVGCEEYSMLGAAGELVLYPVDPSSSLPIGLVASSNPGGIVGPSHGEFHPLGFGLQLVPRSPALFPSNELASIPVAYSLADFLEEPVVEDLGLQLGTEDGANTAEVYVALDRLEARPLIPAARIPARFIRLEDIVAGGDGSGTAPPGNTGIDPRSGAFTTDYFDGGYVDTDGITPQPVPGSPFIDSVFLLKGQGPTALDSCSGCFLQPLTQSGIVHLIQDADETATGWNYILKDRIGGVSTPGIRVGGQDSFTTAIGIHASAGITFNLDALRERHGAATVGCFSTFWGLDDCPTGSVTLQALLTSDPQTFHEPAVATFFAGQGDFITLPIPPQAKYLTLLCISAGGNVNCDHGTFARPIITSFPCEGNTYASFVWDLVPSRVAPQGEPIRIEGEGFSDFTSVRIGGVDLPGQTFRSDRLITGTTPALPPGFHDIELLNFGFLPVFFLPQAIEVAPPPTITSVSPVNALADRRTPALRPAAAGRAIRGPPRRFGLLRSR